MNDNKPSPNLPSIGTRMAALLVGVTADAVVAVVTVLIFANTFPTDKNAIPVAFICAAVLGPWCGLGLRRLMLASDRA